MNQETWEWDKKQIISSIKELVTKSDRLSIVMGHYGKNELKEKLSQVSEELKNINNILTQQKSWEQDQLTE